MLRFYHTLVSEDSLTMQSLTNPTKNFSDKLLTFQEHKKSKQQAAFPFTILFPFGKQ